MANTNKTTIISTLQAVLDNCSDRLTAEQIEKVEGMLEAQKKKSTNRKTKEVNEQDEAYKRVILEVLEGGSKQVNDIRTAHTDLVALSNPKVTSLLTALINEGKVVRSTDKRKSIYSLA